MTGREGGREGGIDKVRPPGESIRLASMGNERSIVPKHVFIINSISIKVFGFGGEGEGASWPLSPLPTTRVMVRHKLRKPGTI